MVAYIRDLAVTKNKWISEESFQHGVALCQSIPGATAMQVAAYVGLRAGGPFGAVAAYLGFGIPAFLLMVTLTAVYSRAHEMATVVSAFSGLQVIVVALVANAGIVFDNTLSYLLKILLKIIFKLVSAVLSGAKYCGVMVELKSCSS